MEEPNNRELLEVKKLESEIRNLDRPWYKNPPTIIGVLTTLFLTAGTVYVAFISDLFDLRNERLELRRESLKIEISEFEKEKDSVIIENFKLIEEGDKLKQQLRNLDERIRTLSLNEDSLERLLSQEQKKQISLIDSLIVTKNSYEEMVDRFEFPILKTRAPRPKDVEMLISLYSSRISFVNKNGEPVSGLAIYLNDSSIVLEGASVYIPRISKNSLSSYFQETDIDGTFNFPSNPSKSDIKFHELAEMFLQTNLNRGLNYGAMLDLEGYLWQELHVKHASLSLDEKINIPISLGVEYEVVLDLGH